MTSVEHKRALLAFRGSLPSAKMNLLPLPTMKTCTKCHELKPVDQFSKHQGGLRAHCKPCSVAYSTQWVEANRERKSAYQKQWRDANRERLAEYEKERYEANPEYKQRYKAFRQEAIRIYGGSCVVCGSTDRLEFDHVNNDGAQHRKVEQANTMLLRITKTGQRITDYELQLLCYDHHKAKTFKSHAF